MSLLRSLLYSLIFYPISVMTVLVAVPLAAIGGRPLAHITHAWAYWHHWCAAHLLGIRTRIEGVPPTGTGVLVAAKHQSMFETIDLVLLLEEPAIVLKRELGEIPGWGWVARRYGMISIDRSGGAGTLRRMVKEAKQAVAASRPILIFPEGTRVAVGLRPPLQPGFAGLYRALKLPVVPVALDSGKLWPRRTFIKRPGIITIRFGEPIEPGLPREEIEARVHAFINSLNPPLAEPADPGAVRVSEA